MDFWDKMVNFFHGAYKIVPLVVTAASIATAIIPNPTSEEVTIITMIHKVGDVLALNVGNNTPIGTTSSN